MEWLLSQRPALQVGATIDDIRAVVEGSDGRLEIDASGAWVRSVRGHSLRHVEPPTVPVKLSDLPAVVYHCTREECLASIEKHGIMPGGTGQRPHVYLSLVPKQNSKRPIVIKVFCRRLAKLGVQLMWSASEATGILLSEKRIPPSCFEIMYAT